MRAVIACLLLAGAGAMELNSDNWDAAVAGKTVFIKFQAPWCGHCKKLKPDWDKLMADFADSTTALVADVDCTTGGKALCSTHGVRGYPTIKYGDPSAMEDYQGGRSYDAFKEFATKNLGPSCGPAHLELCDETKKAEIEKFVAMPAADLDALIKTKSDEMEKLEGDFKTFVETLNKQYQDHSKAKDDGIAAIKDAGLGAMKAVKAHADKKKTEL